MFRSYINHTYITFKITFHILNIITTYCINKQYQLIYVYNNMRMLTKFFQLTPNN